MDQLNYQMNQFLQGPQAILFFAWTLFWRGWALWRAAKNEQKIWFGALLVLNTVGLLEIVYLLFFQKEGRLWEKVFVKKAKKKK